ncbi:hypothetical protein [Fibrella aquatica]|jgi:hypothetical protein|uniref:hypothetical protein n=1 Tax=Fibrella aquatica TaxID=3242487 RepID=UPI003521FF7A
MRRQLIHRGMVAVALATALTACFTEPNYSDTPEIRLVGPPVKVTLEPGTGVGQARRDSVIMTIRLQDGTGDIGEDTRDTTRLRQVFGADTWGNYEIKTFEFVNGGYRELPSSDNSKLFFPRSPLGEQKGAIEGDIDFSQVFFYQRPFRMATVRFQVRIRDRALNVSNTIVTDTISVPLNGR